MTMSTTGVFAAERFICESAGSSSLSSTIDTDSAANAIANTRSGALRPSLGIGYGRDSYGHGVGLGYGVDRFDIDHLATSSASANRELLKLIIDLQHQVEALSQRVDAPQSLICRPLSDDEIQRLDSGSHASVAPDVQAHTGQPRYARVDFVEVFSAPAAGARKVDTLRQGDAVQVFEQRDDWLRNTPDGVLPGWVRAGLLSNERSPSVP
ncbi:SH3 domain-containing protein [Phytohalomonas tamaricis]|uniref:SH3 domain-containing protein n=1 Tax=Phytohalomonas tamaricis TaxID=2081032 RepID=UPI000D0B0C8C|nr:SH3 domain-containing protein [Phytohalomonas tamaricis]